MKRVRIAHIIFPRPSILRPVPEFAWQAIEQLSKQARFDIEVIMPVPQRHFRWAQSVIRATKGARGWPDGLDEALLKLDPKPTLVPYLPVPRHSIESAVTALSVALIARPKAMRPSILHGSFLDEGGYAATQVAEVLGCPSIAVAHGSDVKAAGEKGARGLRSKSSLRKASEVLSVSHYLASEISYFGRTARVLPFTADDEAFSLAPVQAPATPNFLFVGRLEPAKGIDVLIDAFARLAHPKAKLTLVGAKVANFDLDQALRRANIEDQTEYLGELTHSELQTAYANSSCLVLPSRSEGLGCVLIESLLVGRPVIATRVGGIPEIVNQDVGLLVDSIEPTALCQAMKEMLEALEQNKFSPQSLRDRILPKTWRTITPKLEAVNWQLLQCESSL